MDAMILYVKKCSRRESRCNGLLSFLFFFLKYNFLIKTITKDGKISSERPITSLIDQLFGIITHQF